MPQAARLQSTAHATIYPDDGIDEATPVVLVLLGPAHHGGDSRHDVASIAQQFVSEQILAHGEQPAAVDVTVYLHGAEYLAHVTVNREPDGWCWTSCATTDVKAVRS